MVTEKDVTHIASLADISIKKEEESLFAHQFTTILGYFDILDTIECVVAKRPGNDNVFREDVVVPSLTSDQVLSNTESPEDGFFTAPRVM